MKQYCMERSTIFTFFVILETLLSVSYISNCMVVMYQSTFFFFFYQYIRTHLHTNTRSDSALMRLYFCFSRKQILFHTHTHNHNQYLDHTVLLVRCMSHALLSRMNYMVCIKSGAVTECRLLFLNSVGYNVKVLVSRREAAVATVWNLMLTDYLRGRTSLSWNSKYNIQPRKKKIWS